uniref:Uncharacterized protein n=1 Tax=Trichogramma kaykai TaxID=54128 RepID=A0ABD2VYW9_9HYME
MQIYLRIVSTRAQQAAPPASIIICGQKRALAYNLANWIGTTAFRTPYCECYALLFGDGLAVYVTTWPMKKGRNEILRARLFFPWLL